MSEAGTGAARALDGDTELELALSGDFAAGDEPMCDGVHADDAPDHFLCTRCYPNGSGAQLCDDDEDLAYSRESDPEDLT